MSNFLDENEAEYFNERAAIAEFDAHMTRDQAEQFAWQQVLKRREGIQHGYS